MKGHLIDPYQLTVYFLHQDSEFGDVEYPEPTQRPRVPKSLHYSLDQLTLIQVEHRASHSQPLDWLKHVFQNLLLGISIHGYII